MSTPDLPDIADDWLQEALDDGALDPTLREDQEPYVRPTEWSDDSIKAALKAYVAYGSLRAASKLTAVPKSTIWDWLQDPKHSAFLADARRQHSKQSAIKSNVVKRLVLAQLLDRLQFGDERINPTGGTVRVRVAARDLGAVLKHVSEQARADAAYGDDASVTATTVSPEHMAELARQWGMIREELERRGLPVPGLPDETQQAGCLTSPPHPGGEDTPELDSGARVRGEPTDVGTRGDEP